jgi:lipocalin
MRLVDEFAKENLALEAHYRLRSGDIIAVLDKTVEQYGAPEFTRSNNGPDFIQEGRSAARSEGAGFN